MGRSFARTSVITNSFEGYARQTVTVKVRVGECVNSRVGVGDKIKVRVTVRVEGRTS
jgi:hypothetical protein